MAVIQKVPIDKCEPIPKSAPTLDKANKSKSEKVVSNEGLWFFISKTKAMTKIYSIDLGVKVFVLRNNDDVISKIIELTEPIKDILDNRH
jgi:hypothetical protein